MHTVSKDMRDEPAEREFFLTSFLFHYKRSRKKRRLWSDLISAHKWISAETFFKIQNDFLSCFVKGLKKCFGKRDLDDTDELTTHICLN